ncbi:MAG: chromosome segregation protein SMC [Snowella sp.]|nr:chromosome segregation protein SMC [Snowella sp.]
MVHVKRIELSHFKSFGGTTAIPFLPGFTVVSGPNGSGKSNILDALLFCLGLATSKGMRADRLPDLVNNNQSGNKGSSEASVSVTFDIRDLDDEAFLSMVMAANESLEEQNKTEGKENPTIILNREEWTVTRRLKITKGGNYSSTYYINGTVSTATQLHEQLSRLRIYPEGYNIVLQGDVTRIISMNAKERREIIDEMAGVAEFDRKIMKTKETLEEVREREDRCRIIETELVRSLSRLTEDRVKAEKYQKLRTTVQQKQQWELVLKWRSLQQQETRLRGQLMQGETESQQLQASLQQIAKQITENTAEFNRFNAQVKALGEEEQLSVASQLAQQKAKQQQLNQRYQELTNLSQKNQTDVVQTRDTLDQLQQQFLYLNQEKSFFESQTLPQLQTSRQNLLNIVEKYREQSQAIAAASEVWVQEQTALSRQVSQLQEQLTPQRTEQAQLQERQHQLEQSLKEARQTLAAVTPELLQKETVAAQRSAQIAGIQQQIQTLAQQLSQAEQEQSLLQETQNRLNKEQREKQRQLDKLEATKQAQQEAQGTYATQLILQSDLFGVLGLVAQLGQVEAQFQLPLEVSAGARLGYIVVEDDGVAAAGIEILRQSKAGRATFLPLTKIRPPRPNDLGNLRHARGFIDLAVKLVQCDRRYADIFLYVFGNTVVFENLETARPHIGKQRIVTLEGDILESSGAMTGGSRPGRSSIRFGAIATEDSEELRSLRQRLGDIDQIQLRNDQILLQRGEHIKQLSQELTEIRQNNREDHLYLQQLERDIERLTLQKATLSRQINQGQGDLVTLQERLATLNQTIPQLSHQLQQEQEKLTALETSHAHQEWQDIQTLIRGKENELKTAEQALQQGEIQLKDLQNKTIRLEEKITECQQSLAQNQGQSLHLQGQQERLVQELTQLNLQIEATETLFAQLTDRLGLAKQERDRLEQVLRNLQNQQQQNTWQLEKLQITQQERHEQLHHLQEQLATQQTELPNPLPEIPLLENVDLETVNYPQLLEELQKEIRNGQKRLEAMEPVNMLALEEHEKTQARLTELTEKITTIEAERTELLIRIENFTTLRQRAFKDAFDAVNSNFQTIFAELSDGDGYLQLDDPEDPFNGGLNLVAHPKGKPVQRLSSMSGGEKSLTALSFIFALQRYRPSPFYGFDEVDMFLDGANVEKLSKMVCKQAKQAQFIVVSLRRPMIEAAERTIGVTQARGAHTQVLGMKLA